MSNIIVYSKNNCVYCDKAKALLKGLGLKFEEKKRLKIVFLNHKYHLGAYVYKHFDNRSPYNIYLIFWNLKGSFLIQFLVLKILKP